MSNPHGIIVAFDGPDGVGKTTQLELLAEYLQEQGRGIYRTRSSGGTPIGEKLREVSLSAVERPPEVDLYISMAMSVGVGLDIVKQKAQKQVILVDRSPLAIIAYQVFGSQLPEKELGYDACRKMLKLWNIDALLFFDAPEEVLNERRHHRLGHDQNFEKDYFEKKNNDYHRRVDKGYRDATRVAREEGINVISIDANRSIKEIADDVLLKLKPLLE